MVDSVVRIDGELNKEVEDFISDKKNKFKFVNKKQFIDVAVSEFLEKQRQTETFISGKELKKRKKRKK